MNETPNPSNTRAERFYVRQGFTDTQVCLPFYLRGQIYEDTVLVRSLTHQPVLPTQMPAHRDVRG